MDHFRELLGVKKGVIQEEKVVDKSFVRKRGAESNQKSRSSASVRFSTKSQEKKNYGGDKCRMNCGSLREKEE